MYILFAILIFGFLIFIHELGHFLTAKALDVQVNEFSICMGPALWKKQRGETLYAIRCIPIGGYCAMEGEDEESENPRAFTSKAWWRRLIILAAGSFMNYVAGILALVIIYSCVAGFSTPRIERFYDGCPYESEEGLHAGDELYKIDGRRVFIYSDVGMLLDRNTTGVFDLTVKRDGALVELKDFKMVPVEYTVDGVTEMKYGFYFAAEEKTAGAVLKNAWNTSLDFARLVWMGLGDLLSGMVSVKEMSGPVGIVSTIVDTGRSAASVADGLLNVAYLGAFIAINLAVMNMLPLPALDGGRIFLLLVGAVFIYTPGDIAATQVFGFSGAVNDPTTWIIYGVIFVYYLIATVFPIDAIIGKIYPIFGGILLFSAIGVFIGIFVKGFPLLNIWDSWAAPVLSLTGADGAVGTFTYASYFEKGHFLPIFFVTVACGILSGFHSTQTAIISRTMKSEKEGRNTFYNMMVLEGFIAMVWAAGAMGVYNLALQEPNASLATGTVGVVCKYLLGHVGGIIALLGVIVLPITSGDTALRALRLSLSETLHIDQSTNGKRIRLALPIFILVIAILVWAKVNSNGFMILWRYFAWANQTLALFALMCIAVWMFENGKAKWAWMPMIPGGWYAFICVTYIANAHIGFNIPWTIAYIIGVACAVAYVVAGCLYGKKRAAKKLSMNS